MQVVSNLRDLAAVAFQLRRDAGLTQKDVPGWPLQRVNQLEHRRAHLVRLFELQDYLDSLGIAIRIQVKPATAKPVHIHRPGRPGRPRKLPPSPT